MPAFFDPMRLNTAQAANWDRAVEAYSALRAKACNGELWNPPGHPKSALFARLLAGDPPLSAPPPTSFSYPWYSVIETPGPFHVTLDPVPARHGGAYYLAINQCQWRIMEANESAKEVVRWAAGLRNSGREGDPEGTVLAGIHASLRRDPVFTVRFGRWPPYRLYLGRARLSARRSVLDNEGPLNADFSGSNIVLGEVLETGEEAFRKDWEASARARNLPEHKRGFADRVLADAPPPHSPSDAQARANDWVEYWCDAWLMERR